jgi:outer membrane immunogenic protein
MKKSILALIALVGLITIFSGAASAQSRTEVFGGYSFIHVNNSGFTANANGGTGSVAFGVLPLVSVVGDFGVYHGGTNGINGTLESYLFGPKVQVPVGRLHPFGQALFGGAHLGSNNCEGHCGTNTFAMALGGGLDADVAPHIGIRVIQAEYFMTKLQNESDNRQNNLRISAGVTFRF